MALQKRRLFLKRLTAAAAGVWVSVSLPVANALARKQSKPFVFKDSFVAAGNRIWIGEEWWAVPMEDWRVQGGRIENNSVEKNARVNLLTAEIKDVAGDFTVAAHCGLLHRSAKGVAGTCGFAIGITDTTDNDIRSLCYYGKGLNAGVSAKGFLFIGEKQSPLPKDFSFDSFNLMVEGMSNSSNIELKLICKNKEQAVTLSHTHPKPLSGAVAFVNNFDEAGGDTWWCKAFSLSGTAVASKPEQSFGPILWSMYTLSKGVVRLMAQLPPVGASDGKEVKLQLQNNNGWTEAATAPLHPTAYTAHFELPDWKANSDVGYRLQYTANGKTYFYDGTIRKEPTGRPLKFGGLTCQAYLAYPYAPLVSNLKKHDPDILYFSGDQLYEYNGGYPIKRQPESSAILSYLGKWYMFGWAFEDVLKSRPAICTPDDHDVFQGNLWGEGGEGVSFAEWEKVQNAHGGFVQTPAMVNVVTLTNCGHMPEPYHKEALPSGIKPWYTELVYGRVSFAVISDRMFKSGPEVVRPGTGRIDHLRQPVNAGDLEHPSLELLGKRQTEFLAAWVEDWTGADTKVLLSQTLFANVGTHHGDEKMFLHGDMDSNGWPKQKRDEVLRLVRKACAFHVNGDQHLPFLVQYSVDTARDAGWTFCTPAVSTGYIRWGEPDSVNQPFANRPAHGLPNTGLYTDGFGNQNFIYAVGNPLDKFQDVNRYIRAQKKASGFGLITFDTVARTIKMDAFRFLADKDKPSADDRFPGWPFTIKQSDNDGREPVAYLPQLLLNKAGQVVKVKTADGMLVSVMRVVGKRHQPAVHEKGTYMVEVGEGRAMKKLTGLVAAGKPSARVITVTV